MVKVMYLYKSHLT